MQLTDIQAVLVRGESSPARHTSCMNPIGIGDSDEGNMAISAKKRPMSIFKNEAQQISESHDGEDHFLGSGVSEIKLAKMDAATTLVPPPIPYNLDSMMCAGTSSSSAGSDTSRDCTLAMRNLAVEYQDRLVELEEILHYKFNDRCLLLQSLLHGAYVNEFKQRFQTHLETYERLEFIGDAFLGLFVGNLVFQSYPHSDEGWLSRYRGALVDEANCAKLAVKLRLGDFVFLGAGEALSGGDQKVKILADLYESVLGAVFLDGGFNAACAVAAPHFSSLSVEQTISTSSTLDNPKGSLQNCMQRVWKDYCRETGAGNPSIKEKLRYFITQEQGPDHGKQFEAEVVCVFPHHGQLRAKGTGSKKQKAEEAAASLLLKTYLGK